MGNCPNQALAIDGGQGHGNNDNQARGRAFILGAEEARQDPNIMTGTFTLNNHYATTLFDSGADYSFVSTVFIPLLGIEPSDLQFSYEIEIASDFDVIIGMDWLSNHKAEIICHEKVVRLPLPNGKVLRVLGERPKEKMRHLVSAKTKEQKQEELVVVREFPRVFPDELLGFPPIREIEFRIELILVQCRLQNLPIDWHLLKWRSCRVNSKNSRTRVSFDQAHRLRENGYLKDSKRRAFWSLNEDILKITILNTNTPYPSKKIRRICACIHQRPQRSKAQYAVSKETKYAVFKIWNVYNILEDIKRGPYSKKSPIRRIQSLDTPYRTDFLVMRLA
ncbi:putative reverse transcriptase domain-containing protein [Tanacetum coccineum]|uniref:Reverse transcriptase domain-containing protein n=1 Tax=Tanacetum coccineum TaxID=301880 RepID=A0ABQ5ATY1_9ASTR